MKVKLWIDLPNDYFVDPKTIFATGDPSSIKMSNQTRYLIEVDLPVGHFKPIADIKVEAVLIGKEEE